VHGAGQPEPSDLPHRRRTLFCQHVLGAVARWRRHLQRPPTDKFGHVRLVHDRQQHHAERRRLNREGERLPTGPFDLGRWAEWRARYVLRDGIRNLTDPSGALIRAEVATSDLRPALLGVVVWV